MALTIAEFTAGLNYWVNSTRWPRDLQNSDYTRWRTSNSDGTFLTAWWNPFLRELGQWRANRPKSYAFITQRFNASTPALAGAWKTSCAPYLGREITQVTWQKVAGFPAVVAPLKGVASPVFTSKFCHFLLPKVFPVVDNAAMGNRWPDYATYFQVVQNEWAATSPNLQTAFTAAVTAQVQSTGQALSPDFPIVNKAVELCLIGRWQSR
jgi:hypothetical protein